MTKYTSNEQYEKDKARLIDILIGDGVGDFAVNMLKQSKWIGAYPTENDINAMKLSAYADGYEDCERYKEYVEDNG